MAIVPIQEAPQQKLQPLDTTPLQAADYGGVAKGVSAGLEATGTALDANAQQKAMIQAYTDEGNVKGAVAQLMDANDSVLRTGPNAYLHTTDANAMNGMADAQAAVTKNRDQILASLSNDRQRGMFQGIADRQLRKENDAIAQHANEQTVIYQNKQSGVLSGQLGNSAIIAATAGDEDTFNGNINAMQKEIETNNTKNGLPLDYGVDKAVSGTIQNTVAQLATQDPAKAQAWFDSHRALMKDQDAVLATEKLLEPYVTDAHIDAAVNAARSGGNGQVVPGNAPVSDNVTLAGKIHGAENPGDPTAKNPLSSAKGPDQFTDQTWLGTMKQHGPAQFANAIVKQGNKYVIADPSQAAAIWAARTDPAQSQAATIALAQDNKIALGRAGVPVNDGTVYLAHLAGAGGAISLLKANTSDSAALVLGNDVAARNKWAQGTVQDAINFANKKMGGTPSSTMVGPAPQQDDTAAQLARIEGMDLPLGLKQKAEDRVVALADRDKMLLSNQQSQAMDAATAIMVGDQRPTSLSAIPPTIMQNLKPEHIRTLQDIANSNLKGPPVAENPSLYLELSDKAAKGTLTTADLTSSYGKLPLDDWKHFSTLYEGIQKKDASQSVTMGAINTATENLVNTRLPLADPTIAKNDRVAQAAFKQQQVQRRYDFQKAMLSDVAVWQSNNPGKKISAADIQSMADRRLIQTNAGQTTGAGWLSSGTPAKPVYQFESGNTPGHVRIPVADANRIRSDMMRGGLANPSDQDVFTAYMHEARGG